MMREAWRNTLQERARLHGRRDFDLELYEAACDQLAMEELASETIQDDLKLRHGWFREAFYPSNQVSALEITTAIPPYAFPGREVEIFRDVRHLVHSTSTGKQLDSSLLLDTALYGDRVFTRIKSGLFARLPAEKSDLLGTGELDCCTAFAGIGDDGALWLAHIPGPGTWSVKHFFTEFLREPDFAHSVLIYPKLPIDAYLRIEDAELAHDTNERFRILAEELNLSSLTYPSSSTPGSRDPTVAQSGLRTLVTVDQDGLCLSVNKERVSGAYPVSKLHYSPLVVQAIPWE